MPFSIFVQSPPSNKIYYSHKLYLYDFLLMSFGPGPYGPVPGNNGQWSAELMLP